MDPGTSESSETFDAVDTFIIDGYNLLHRGVGLVRGRDLRDQRRRLEILLGEFVRARPAARVVLVYDGALDLGPVDLGGPAGGRGPGTDRVEVLFSRPPQSGDDLVLAESERRRRQARVVVVSSDRKDIADHLGPGVEAMSSERFTGLLEDAIEGKAPAAASGAGPAAPAAEKPEAVPPEEVEEWGRVFGEAAAAAPVAPPAEQRAGTGSDAPPSEKPEEISPTEVEEWRRLFSEGKRRDDRR